MKLTSSFLFVATGLILCATLHAQQYHDAAAFGLKGNVKECKVVDAADGSAASDDHHFSFLGFTSDGKLDRWSDSYLDINRVSYLSEIDRSGGRLDGFLYDDCEDYRFHYSGGTLTGYSNSCLDYFIDIIEFTEVCTFHDDGKDSFSVKSFMVEYSSTELDSVIKKGFNSGKDIFPILAAYCDSHSLDKYQAYIKRYIIRERDSHGNYTLLYNTKSGKSFKRIITYWDDEPTSAKPTQAPKSPVTETTPKKTVTTSNTTGIKAVDLGLPSGVKWADRNIGASSQKDYGNYYAWGETTPKTTYTWDNYVFGKEGRLKKYNDTDNKLVLDPGDDVVSVELGSSWRMPTEEEMNELKANCTWNLTSVNGVKGFELQSKINGNSIFLPAGGYYNGNQAILKGGSGYYWTSTLDESLPDSSEHLNFDDFSGKQYVFLKDRYIGMTVRPVTKTASTAQEVTKPVQAPVVSWEPASARQYYDAAAFGLKGNVKECKVVSAEDGSASYDPHHFSTVSFTRDGKLVSWFEDSRQSKDLALGITDVKRDKNQQPLVFKVEESSYRTDEYCFQYNGEQLAGSYILSWEDDDIFGLVEDTRVSVISEGANNSVTNSFFGVEKITQNLTKLINQELYNGSDILSSLKKYVNENLHSVREYRSFTGNYKIKERDSHGNYTILSNEDDESIKRIITYWDDEPAVAPVTKAPETVSPVEVPKVTDRQAASSFKISDSRELTLSDLISKPLGIIENPSESLWDIDPAKVIRFIKENPKWKYSKWSSSYSIDEGYNQTFKGYPLKVSAFEFDTNLVEDSYGYCYYITLAFNDQTKESTFIEIEKLYNTVVQEFGNRGIDLNMKTKAKSRIASEGIIGNTRYLVSLNSPVEIEGLAPDQEYYVTIGCFKQKE